MSDKNPTPNGLASSRCLWVSIICRAATAPNAGIASSVAWAKPPFATAPRSRRFPAKVCKARSRPTATSTAKSTLIRSPEAVRRASTTRSILARAITSTALPTLSTTTACVRMSWPTLSTPSSAVARRSQATCSRRSAIASSVPSAPRVTICSTRSTYPIPQIRLITIRVSI